MRFGGWFMAASFIIGCGGGSTATDAKSGVTGASAASTKAPTTPSEPATRRLSTLGESCARTADCVEDLRCIRQECTQPKTAELKVEKAEAGQDLQAKVMARVEATCKCMMASSDREGCLKTFAEERKALESTLRDLPEEARTALKEAETTRFKACTEAAMAKVESQEPASDAKEENAGEDQTVAKVGPKKVERDELPSTNKLGGIDPVRKVMNSGTGGLGNKLAVAFSANELEVGHGTAGLGFQGSDVDGNKRGLGKKKSKRAAKVKIASGSARGFCSKSDIKRNIRRRAGAIRYCYEKQLSRNPKLAGKITARWTIGMDGRVQGPVSAFGLGAVSGCVASKIKKIRFKPPEGGVCVVQWPLVFSSGG